MSDPHRLDAIDQLKRAGDEAAKRGQRIVGWENLSKPGERYRFRFSFAPLIKPRKAKAAAPAPRAVRRGAAQGSLL